MYKGSIHHKAAQKRWQQDNKERCVQLTNESEERKKRKDPRLWAISRIFRERKRVSENSNIPFDIDLEYLLSLPTEFCPVFKYKLEWASGTEKSGSLDKINPGLGYTRGNVVWMSLRANILKRDASKEEILALADWITSV